MSKIPHILLVEDNVDDYEATIRSFKKNRFLNPIKWCQGGQQALDYLQGNGVYARDPEVLKPDLILLDLNMPGMDGRKLLTILKHDEDLKIIPVIILTTSNDQRDINACYEIGASTYIQKPVSFEGLTEAVRAMQEYWFGVAILPNDEGLL